MSYLKKLREAAEKATPGRWDIECIEYDPKLPGKLPKWQLSASKIYDTTGMVGAGIVTGSVNYFAYLNAYDPNAEYIAQANPQTILLLLDLLDETKEWVAHSDSCDHFAALSLKCTCGADKLLNKIKQGPPNEPKQLDEGKGGD